MKTILISITWMALLFASCAPSVHCRTVKREYTCKFMKDHPIKDTINGDLRHSYVVKYHAGLYQDEMQKCNCNK